MTDAERAIREIRELIDRSSLGGSVVRRLRARTASEIVELIVARTENRSACAEFSEPRDIGASITTQSPPGGQGMESMSKSTRNSGKGWSSKENQQLQQLARENTPTRVIGLKLGRTEGAVRTHAAQAGVSLKPTNQSPYNRRSR